MENRIDTIFMWVKFSDDRQHTMMVPQISKRPRYLILVYREEKNVQGDQKKHANWLFFREIVQPNLPKFAYNLIRGRRVRI